MAFKVKDLMINVLPADPAACALNTLPCAQGHVVCTHITVCGIGCTHVTCGCTHCTIHPSVCAALSCGGCSMVSACTPCGSAISIPTPPGSPVGPGPEDAFHALRALKEQLKQQIAEVEKQEKAAQESLHPQTVAEVDDLQEKLQDAITELKARRAELVKSESAKKEKK